jgi:hypothetical protein
MRGVVSLLLAAVSPLAAVSRLCYLQQCLIYFRQHAAWWSQGGWC